MKQTAAPDAARPTPAADERHAPRAQPRVCFVAPNNYPLIAPGGDATHIGGAEVQRLRVARELAARGWSVSFITRDHGQPDGCAHDGLRVFKIRRRVPRFPILAQIDGWRAVLDALRRADADVYYQRVGGLETGQVAWWCRRHGRAFVFGTANDRECDGRLRLPGPRREGWLYRYGLRRADAVIAQTRRQQELLRTTFALQTHLVRSCVTPPPESADESTFEQRRAAPRVLWVGAFRPPKRLSWVLELAQRCPAWRFDIVGAGGVSEDATRRALEGLRHCPNVRLHGYVPHDRLTEFYRRAAVLLSTSVWEGYPNVFLEAWSCGLPTVSTVDPDGVVTEHGLGRVGGSVAELAQGIAALLASGEVWCAAAARARAFVRAQHGVGPCVDAFEGVLRQALAAAQKRNARRAPGASTST